MSKTILIVDDSATMRQLVKHTLSQAGYDVVEAVDGADGVSKLNGSASPNLVITDLNMPNLDGFGFIKAVHGMPAFKFTPILMRTTESDDSKKKMGQQVGATGWMVKPFNPQQMLAVIKKVMPG